MTSQDRIKILLSQKSVQCTIRKMAAEKRAALKEALRVYQLFTSFPYSCGQMVAAENAFDVIESLLFPRDPVS